MPYKNSVQVETFATYNDTDKWLVIVDGYFALYDSKEEAIEVFKSIGGNGCIGDELAETPFGCAEICRPHHRPRSRLDGSDMTESIISEHRPIDLKRYIARNWEKQRRFTYDHLAARKPGYIINIVGPWLRSTREIFSDASISQFVGITI